MPFSPGDLEGATSLKNYENNSQGIMFIIILYFEGAIGG